MTPVKIATTADIAPDRVTKVSAGGKSLLVSKQGDKFCAIANKCPHLGLPLAKGKVSNGQITCPFHGSTFDLCSGQNVEWVNSFMGIPAPGIVKKAMAMKGPTNVESFPVAQNGDELLAEI